MRSKSILLLGASPALMIGLVACSLPTNVIVLIPDEGGTVGKVEVDKNGVQKELSGAYAAVATGSGSRAQDVFVADRAAVEAAFAGALAAQPPAPVVHAIFFVIGQAEIDPGSDAELKATVAAALATPYASISVVGHSDAIGDDAENLALSLRRATAVRDILVKSGVRASEIDIGYHGSNNPLVPTPRGVPEPRNRRVEVTIR
jgi:outer membrane protein OmpA-like peptidoglycan-associated protein